MTGQPLSDPHRRDAVFLCAAWCNVCRDFQATFATLARDHPDIRFHWLDIEEHADWVDSLEVENFPTLLVAIDDKPVFWGLTTPQTHAIKRLLSSSQLAQPLDPKLVSQLKTVLTYVKS